MKKSWKTTIGGSLTAAGVVLLGAIAMDWMPQKVKTGFMITGFVMTAAGALTNGLFGRDNNVTSEEAGSKKIDV